MTTTPHLGQRLAPGGAVGSAAWLERARNRALSVTGTVVLLALAVVVAGWTWTREIRAGLWIDEGLSVGIASHPLADIPHVLRQDGSPPLYYMALHVWMSVVGHGEARTHALSLLFAVLTIPAAFWAGCSLAGRRAAWFCGVLAAVSPFLTTYAQETRMYSLVVLLGVLCTASYLQAFVLRRRAFVAPFALLLAALLYTHNWAIFFAVAALAGLIPAALATTERRRLAIDALLGFGGAVLLYLPWVPILLDQIRHTGAPWSRQPTLGGIPGSFYFMMGQDGAIALLVAGAAGLVAVALRRQWPEATIGACLAVLALGTFALAFAAAFVSPSWAPRYLAMVVAPLVLLAGLALARARALGVAALVLLAIWGWVAPTQIAVKSNVREIARVVEPDMRPGDLVITTQPEQVADLHYYLPAGLRYADPRGAVSDPRVMNWRDAVAHLRRSRIERSLAPELRRLPAGGHVLLVTPLRSGGTTWARLVRRRSAGWVRALKRDPRFRRVHVAFRRPHGVAYSSVRALLFVRRA